MQIWVPYFEQKKDYTCGPAVMRMVAAFFGTHYTLEQLYEIASPDPDAGTRNKDMIKVAKKLGFSVYSKNKASIKDIKKFLNKDLPVIVNFIEPRGKEEGHHSLIVGITDREIIFNDPAYGQGFSMGIAEFLSRWRSGFEPYQRWMMVVMPKRSFFGFLKSFVLAKISVRTGRD